MSGSESVLNVMLLQAQFEIAEAAADVATAAASAHRAEREEGAARERCDEVVGQLRKVTSRTRIDPALVAGMQRICRHESATLRVVRTELEAAKEREDRARERLASLRAQERTLEEAMRIERRKRKERQQVVDLQQADDLWLQRPQAIGP